MKTTIFFSAIIVIMFALSFSFSSCEDKSDKNLVPKTVVIDGVQLTFNGVIEDTGKIKVFIKNLTGNSFAYAEMTQTQSIDPMIEQIMFSESDTLTIDVNAGCRLRVYEFKKNPEGRKMVPKMHIYYLINAFK